MTRRRRAPVRSLHCEHLEARCVLSTTIAGSDLIADSGDFHAVIVAGDPNGTPSDSPAIRVDPNTGSSPFAGVGSLRVSTRRGSYICTGTPIDTTHVVTAAHCVDINNDGRSDKKDGIKSIDFQLNLDTDSPGDLVDVSLRASSWRTHPDFTGFNRPSVNDDLAVITLSSPLPAGVPVYPLATSNMAAGTNLTMVGYGQSGDGVSGYTVGASWTVKRDGENVADAFYTQDDTGRPDANEVFRYDFDGPSGNGTFGGATLGNDRETTLGGGDSGGPSFVVENGQYRLAGVNTFTQGFNAPRFGSLGGGINTFPYQNWILTGAASGSAGGGSGGRGFGGGAASGLGINVATLPMSPLEDSPLSVVNAGGDALRGESPTEGEVSQILLSEAAAAFDPSQWLSASTMASDDVCGGLTADDRSAETTDEWFSEFGLLDEPLPLLV